MKTMKLAALAMGALLFAACSNEESLEVTRTTKGEAMTFVPTTPNMVRGTNLNDYGPQAFGVFTYKTVGSTESVVMDNYKVAYNETAVTDASNWAYHNISGQELKYWDLEASNYSFYGYVPFDANQTLSGTSMKEIDFGTVTAGTSKDVEVMVATTVRETTGPTDQVSTAAVPMTFKRYHGLVNVAIYAPITNYYAEVTSANIAVKGKIVTSTALKYDFGATAPAYSNTDATAAETTINFTTVDGSSVCALSNVTDVTVGGNSYKAISATKSSKGYSLSPTNYFCLPATNGALTVTLSYRLINKTTGEVLNKNDKSVTIPVSTTVGETTTQHTTWAQNTKYTYILKLSTSDLTPIIFDGITVDSYDTNEVEDGDYTLPI